jgi:hypothetical protein
MEVERPMKLRTILATSAVAVTALAAAGPAGAQQTQRIPEPPGPSLDVTMSGPSGVVWTGRCPAFIYEDATGQLPANCKPHGTGQIAWLSSLGVTSIVESYQGQTAISVTIAPDGRSVTSAVDPGPWTAKSTLGVTGFAWPEQTQQTVSTCPIVDGALSLTLPCQDNAYYTQYKAQMAAANVVFIAKLRAKHARKARRASRR